MPLTGAIPEGPSFFCPHCGALYAVTYARLSSSDSNEARCVVCGQIMDKWDFNKDAYLQAHSSPRRSLIPSYVTRNTILRDPCAKQIRYSTVQGGGKRCDVIAPVCPWCASPLPTRVSRLARLGS